MTQHEWNTCDTPHKMIKLICKNIRKDTKEHKNLVLCCCEFTKYVLCRLPEDIKYPTQLVPTVEAWICNAIELDQVKKLEVECGWLKRQFNNDDNEIYAAICGAAGCVLGLIRKPSEYDQMVQYVLKILKMLSEQYNIIFANIVRRMFPYAYSHEDEPYWI